MRLNDVEYAIRNVLRSAEVFGAGLARREALVRSAMVEPILWSLGWRTWLPWECRPDFTLGRAGSTDYVLFNRDGEVVVAKVRSEGGGKMAAGEWAESVGLRKGVLFG